MADIQFSLAGIALRDFQIPEKMPWGGDHRLNIHKLPGGNRVFDAMGPDNRPVSWTGMFLGPNAISIARAFDVLRQNGAAVTLQWGVFSFLVVISSFKPLYERGYQIPYEITCEVVADQSAPNNVSPADLDSLCSDDVTDSFVSAQALGMTIPGDLPGPQSTLAGATVSISNSISAATAGVGLNLNGVASALTTLRGAVSAVSSFTGASVTALAPVNAALSGARSAVGAVLGQSEGSLLTNGVVGNVIAGVPGLVNAQAFAAYAQIAQQAPLLRAIDNNYARMQVNLAQGAN